MWFLQRYRSIPFGVMALFYDVHLTFISRILVSSCRSLASLLDSFSNLTFTSFDNFLLSSRGSADENKGHRQR